MVRPDKIMMNPGSWKHIWDPKLFYKGVSRRYLVFCRWYKQRRPDILKSIDTELIFPPRTEVIVGIPNEIDEDNSAPGDCTTEDVAEE